MLKKQLINLICVVSLIVMTFLAYVPAMAASTATIDFEGLSEGAFVSNVSSGNGISGDPFAGSIGVFGFNPAFPGLNSAMVFDATCTGGCTGGDFDLFAPALGNILIVSEDRDSTDPDDSDLPGQYITFDYSTFGPGMVTVESLVVGDVEPEESGGFVRLFNGSTVLATIAIPVTGNGTFTTLNIGVSGVTFMKVLFKGSAAIDNIRLSIEEPPPPPPPPGDEGCTPGYWKNHLSAWAATGFSTSQTLEDVFDVPDEFGLDSRTLLQALSFSGGTGRLGSARILLRSAVAAILNAAHPDVAYPMGVSEIISAVNAALSGNRAGMLILKNTLDANNNLGCPLN